MSTKLSEITNRYSYSWSHQKWLGGWIDNECSSPGRSMKTALVAYRCKYKILKFQIYTGLATVKIKSYPVHFLVITVRKWSPSIISKILWRCIRIWRIDIVRVSSILWVTGIHCLIHESHNNDFLFNNGSLQYQTVRRRNIKNREAIRNKATKEQKHACQKGSFIHNSFLLVSSQWFVPAYYFCLHSR